MSRLQRINGEAIDSNPNLSIRELAEKHKSNLQWADLRWADLRRADLQWADLQWANLRGADLQGANLRRADLRRANLRGANLQGANLRGADLRGANLRGANLQGADLDFHQFPSIRLLSSIPLGILSDGLMIELMRRDAYAHPHPERFDEWAKGGQCPYQNEEYFWNFDYEAAKKLWKPGLPQMADRDLIIAICKEKKWGITNYLPLSDMDGEE